MNKKKIVAVVAATTLMFSGAAAALADGPLTVNTSADVHGLDVTPVLDFHTAEALLNNIKEVATTYKAEFTEGIAAQNAAKAKVETAKAKVEAAEGVQADAEAKMNAANKALTDYTATHEVSADQNGAIAAPLADLQATAKAARAAYDVATTKVNEANAVLAHTQEAYDSAVKYLNGIVEKFRAELLNKEKNEWLPAFADKLQNVNAAAKVAAAELAKAQADYKANPSATNKLFLDAATAKYNALHQFQLKLQSEIKFGQDVVAKLQDPKLDLLSIVQKIFAQSVPAQPAPAPAPTPGKKNNEAAKKATVKAASAKKAAAEVAAPAGSLARTGAESTVPALLTVVATGLAVAFATVRRLFVK